MNTPFSSFSLKLISYLNYMPVFTIVQESVMSFFYFLFNPNDCYQTYAYIFILPSHLYKDYRRGNK